MLNSMIVVAAMSLTSQINVQWSGVNKGSYGYVNFGSGLACAVTGSGKVMSCDVAAGAGSYWTLTGSDLYRNSKVRVGSTSAPSATLDVTGTAAISGDLACDTNTLYVDAANNRVGVVTGAPLAALDVRGDVFALGATSQFYVDNLTDAAARLMTVGSNQARITSHGGASRYLTLGYASGTDLVWIKDGRVGIGTTVSSADNLLKVAGTIESTTGGVKYPDANTQTVAFDRRMGARAFFSLTATCSAGTCTTAGDYNLTSVTFNATGTYDVTLNYTPTDVRFSVTCTSTSGGAPIVITSNKATSSPQFNVLSYDVDGTLTNGRFDCTVFDDN